MKDTASCSFCGDSFEPTVGRGRPRLYCSNMCKSRAYVARHYNVDTHGIIERWGTDCYLCGDPVDLNIRFGLKMANVDHVIPLSRGGATDISNLRLVHYGCNLHKGTHLVCPHCAENIA